MCAGGTANLLRAKRKSRLFASVYARKARANECDTGSINWNVPKKIPRRGGLRSFRHDLLHATQIVKRGLICPSSSSSLLAGGAQNTPHASRLPIKKSRCNYYLELATTGSGGQLPVKHHRKTPLRQASPVNIGRSGAKGQK